MGASPDQNDLGPHDSSSRERKPPQEQLDGDALTTGELARARQIADENVVGLWRAGALLVVFFQLIYAAEQRYTSASTFDATLSLHLANIVLGVMFFLLSFTGAIPRYWRQTTLLVCIAIMISTTAIGAESIRIEPLFVSVLVMLVAAGTLAPWDWLWQAALGSFGIACFYALGRAHGIVDSDPAMHWLGLMTAVALGQSNVYLQMKNRRAIARNLADRLSTGQKLADSEEKFRQIFQQSGDMVVVNNLDTGTILEVNNQFVKRSRVPRELVVGRIDTDFNFFAEPEVREQFMKELHESGVVKNLEVQLNGVGYGRPMPALISAVVVRLNNQNCAIIVVREISDVKEAERKLRNSEAMLRQMFDSSVDNIALTDLSDGVIIDVNNEMVRSLGLAKTEMIGKRYDEIKVWESTERLRLFTETLLERREVRNFETVFRTAGGATFPALISAVVLDLGGRECALSIARDITDLAAARQKALAASRAKTEFLSSMSHEIRTPMNAILGMADLMGESDLDLEQRRYLGTIISNGNALLELINSILDLARVESGRLALEAVAFDVVELTEKVADTLAVRAHEKGIELAVRFSSALPKMLVGDSLRLRQVLTNLIGNAIKFTERGEVAVSVALNPDTSNRGNLLFSVRDTGIGLTPDALQNVFSAFTQADSSTTRKFGGSGLGLTIVERLVALMGGRVWVESELGSGSTFYFTAELGLPVAVINENEMQQSRGLELSGIRVLLVDDNATARSIASELLSAQGGAVTEAASGVEALLAMEAVNRNRAPFGLMIVDSQMPTMDGFDLIRQIRLAPNGNAPVVMLATSSGLANRLGVMRELGLKHYVVKPVKRHQLYAAISAAMAEAAAPSDARAEPRPALPINGSAVHLVDRPLRILLADDSVDNRRLIEAYLKKSRYILEQVEDGQAALDRFIARPFDLVLMDIQMPVLDGYEAVSMIRLWEVANERGRTPIIALSASALEADVRHAIQAGCDLHVSKPVKKSTLLVAIAEMVEDSDCRDPGPEPASNNGRDGTSVHG